jgi:hypothetical protein
MRHILDAIVNNGQREHNGKEYILDLLFSVITEFKPIRGLVKKEIDGQLFVDVDSISDEVSDRLGLYRSSIYNFRDEGEVLPKTTADTQEDTLDEGPATAETPPGERCFFAEIDVQNAIALAKQHESHFEDYFIDREVIARKAMTLSILRKIGQDLSDKLYLETVFKLLKENKIDCDLPLDSIQKFYRKLKWYCRTGFFDGCINIENNPNI